MIVQMKRPMLVVGSTIRPSGATKTMTWDGIVKEQVEQHLKVLCKLNALQSKQGRFFLHSHVLGEFIGKHSALELLGQCMQRFAYMHGLRRLGVEQSRLGRRPAFRYAAGCQC